MDIVFNVNSLGLEGLGATLTSLIRNCSNPQELKLFFLYSDFGKNDKENIDKLLRSEKFNGDITFINYDAKAIFGHLKSLHGDWTTYGRLLIADYIESETVLYLDSDLIISLDVLGLKGIEFDDNILAAVYSSTVEWALENAFFINSLKWSLNESYFNAGVILFNLKKWREANINAQWKSLTEQYPNELQSHDQTLLNAICKSNFTHLPPLFNNPWYPGKKKPDEADFSIIHFVGSPKPWDLFGKMAHQGYDIWNTYNTAAWKKQYGKITKQKLMRTWKIKKSILKSLMQRKKENA